MTRWRTRRRGTAPDRGAAAVEFAIVLSVLLLIIFGIIDFGRLLYVVQGMKSASREGARTASVRADWAPSGTAGTIANSITGSAAGPASLAGGTLTYSGVRGATTFTQASTSAVPLCTAAGPSTTITVSTTFRWFTPVFLFASNINSVTQSTTMRCE